MAYNGQFPSEMYEEDSQYWESASLPAPSEATTFHAYWDGQLPVPAELPPTPQEAAHNRIPYYGTYEPQNEQHVFYNAQPRVEYGLEPHIHHPEPRYSYHTSPSNHRLPTYWAQAEPVVQVQQPFNAYWALAEPVVQVQQPPPLLPLLTRPYPLVQPRMVAHEHPSPTSSEHYASSSFSSTPSLTPEVIPRYPPPTSTLVPPPAPFSAQDHQAFYPPLFQTSPPPPPHTLSPPFGFSPQHLLPPASPHYQPSSSSSSAQLPVTYYSLPEPTGFLKRKRSASPEEDDADSPGERYQETPPRPAKRGRKNGSVSTSGSSASEPVASGSTSQPKATAARGRPVGSTNRVKAPQAAATEARPPDRRRPFVACKFCRVRKIACAPLYTLPGEPRSCNQCARRRQCCEYPEETRRGSKKRKEPPEAL